MVETLNHQKVLDIYSLFAIIIILQTTQKEPLIYGKKEKRIL